MAQYSSKEVPCSVLPVLRRRVLLEGHSRSPPRRGVISAPKSPSAVFGLSLTSTSSLRSCRSDENRIFLCYTSLGVVRCTFEECRSVRSIFCGFRVAVDERDRSMDSRFPSELQGFLGGRKPLTVQRAFIGGRHIGGAVEIGRLHETGELKKFLEGIPSPVPRRLPAMRLALSSSYV